MNLETFWLILGMLFIHWFADFVMQTDWQATNKSKNWKALLSHTYIYSMWFFCGMAVLGNLILDLNLSLKFGISFFAITFIMHTITDYFTSRLNTKLWNNKKVHNFFVSVGFDQWLHYAQLFGTYYLLTA
jgi:hypothetical protein